MPEKQVGAPVRSLAGIQPGESVQIRLILFDSLRKLCRDLGLAEGMVVGCHAEAKLHLLLRTVAAPTILLERDWARFIQVVDVPGGPPALQDDRGPHPSTAAGSPEATPGRGRAACPRSASPGPGTRTSRPRRAEPTERAKTPPGHRPPVRARHGRSFS